MKKMNFKKAIATLTVVTAMISNVAVLPASAANVTRNELNENSMFFVQDRSNNCTHASITMLLKRVARIEKIDYQSITQDATRSTVWGSNGAAHEFTYKGISISYRNKDQVYSELASYNGSRKKLFIDLLKKHPEGIVVYDSWHTGGNSPDQPSKFYPQAPAQISDDFDSDHAILLTDYDAATDTFYAADPANSNVAKRISLSQTTRPHIDYFDTYWYYSGSSLKDKVSDNGGYSSSDYSESSNSSSTQQSSSGKGNFGNSNVKFNSVTYPIKQKAGSTFAVYGSIQALNGNKIKQVVVDIDEKTSNGSYVNVDKTVRTMDKSYYNLHDIDDRIWFNRASKANTTYRYKISVTTSNGVVNTLTKEFKTF